MAAICTPGLLSCVKICNYRRVQPGDDIRLECPQDSDWHREVCRDVREPRGGWPVAVADQPTVVEISLENGYRCLPELGCEVHGHVVEGPGRAVEVVCIEGDGPFSHGCIEPVGDLACRATGGGEASQTGDYVGCGRIGDVVRIWLDVQADKPRMPVLE